jgi:hypothetical protein
MAVVAPDEDLFRRGGRLARCSGDGRVFGVEQGECYPHEVLGACTYQGKGTGVPPRLSKLTGPRVECCPGWLSQAL